MFEKFTKTMKDYGENLKTSAQNFSETATLKKTIDDARKEMHEVFADLGSAFYGRNTKDVPMEYEGYFKKIAQLEEKIQQSQEQLNQLRGTWKCESCGTENTKEALFCGNCGTKKPEEKKPEPAANPSFCSNCGAPLVEGAMFCGGCGTKLMIVAQPTASEVPVQAEPEAAPEEPTQAEPETVPTTPTQVEPEAAPEVPTQVEPEVAPEEPTQVEPEAAPEVPSQVEPEAVPTIPTQVEPEAAPEEPTQAEPEAAPVAQPATRMFCENCGARIIEGSVFCGECGTKLS